jgi:DNA-binding CsgD family transcriptional regulator
MEGLRTIEDYVRSVTNELAALVGADLAVGTLITGTQQPPIWVGCSTTAEQLAQHQSYQLADEGTERALTCGDLVVTLDDVVQSDGCRYHEDRMVQEFYLPSGIVDTVGLAMQWGDRATSVIELNATRRNRSTFGDNGKHRVAVLAPAVATGLRLWIAFGQALETTGAALDLAGDGALIIDETSQLVHSNRSAMRLLTDIVDGPAIRATAERLARQLITPSNDHGPPTTSFSGRAGGYRLDALVVPGGTFGPSRQVLVRVGQHRHTPSPDHQRLEAAGLTKREAEVAVAIALGAAAKEIAQRLGISVHTVRRHTERVFRKLHVQTRASVASLVLGSTPL